MLGKHFDCAFGVVPRRQRVLRSRKGILSTTVHKSFAEFLGFLIGFCHKCRDQIAKVLRSGLITKLGCGVSVQIPEVAGWPERGPKPNVWITMLSTPAYSLW